MAKKKQRSTIFMTHPKVVNQSTYFGSFGERSILKQEHQHLI